MSKKSKSTSTMTPVVPEWITTPVQGMLGQIGQIGAMDPYAMVAGSNPLIDRGVALAGGLGGTFQQNLWDEALAGLSAPAIDDILGGGAPSASATSGLDHLDGWFNRYTDDVIAATLGRFDEDARGASAAETLRMAGSGAFSGSGAALAAAARERERTMNRGQLEAGLRHQGWESAAGHAGRDADRFSNVSMTNAQLAAQHQALQLQAAQARANGFADLAAGYGQDQRQTIGLLGELGGYLRGMEQERLNAPLTLAQAQGGLLGQLPLNLWQGQHTTGTTKESDPWGTAISLLSAANGWTRPSFA